MSWEWLAQYLKLPVFALVAARLGGLLMLQPVLGALSIPMRFRVMLILALAALITPLVRLPAVVPDTPLQVVFAMASEMLLGAVLGLVLVMCFVGLQLGGLLIAQEAGLAFGQIVDPSSEDEETILGVFYLQFAAVVYLAVGGHRAMISACLDTFDTLPLLSARPVSLLDRDMLCQALTLSGHVAFRVAGPTLLALFLVNVALGFVSRTMPQLNVLAVGFSLKAMIAFVVMAVSLPTAADAFIDALQRVFVWMHQSIGVA